VPGGDILQRVKLGQVVPGGDILQRVELRGAGGWGRKCQAATSCSGSSSGRWC